MKLNIENFNIRRSNPYIAGSSDLAPGTERYIAKAQGLIGLEIFEGDIFLQRELLNLDQYYFPLALIA